MCAAVCAAVRATLAVAIVLAAAPAADAVVVQVVEEHASAADVAIGAPAGWAVPGLPGVSPEAAPIDLRNAVEPVPMHSVHAEAGGAPLESAEPLEAPSASAEPLPKEFAVSFTASRPAPPSVAPLAPVARPTPSTSASPSVSPTAVPSGTPPGTPKPTPTPAARAMFALPLELEFAGEALPDALDSSIRAISARMTATRVADWILKSTKVLPPPAATGPVVRQAASESPRRWRAMYHARLSALEADSYASFVRGGGLSTALRSEMPAGSSAPVAMMPGNPTRVLVAQPGDASGRAAPPAGAPADGKPKSRTRGPPVWQIAAGAGLAGLVAIAALAALALRRARRPAIDETDEALARVSSVRGRSSTMGAECRLTSLGGAPRGPEALREQSGILDWQASAAAAAGHGLQSGASAGVRPRSLRSSDASATEDASGIDESLPAGDDSLSPVSSAHQLSDFEVCDDDLDAEEGEEYPGHSFVSFGYGGPKASSA